jgi:hypothetical protein
MKKALFGFGVLATMALTPFAHAGITFYTSQATFNTAASAYTFLGLENWNSGVGAGVISFNDSLLPGVGNGPMPVGTNAAMGMTVQSNRLGDAPTTLNPFGASGLAFGAAGSAGASGNLQPTKQVSANNSGNSFDMLFTVVGGSTPKAIDLTPMYYRVLGTGNSATLNVRVYDTSNLLIGTATVTNVADVLENAYLGLEVTGATTIGRVNVAVSGNTTDVSGADNIRLFGSNPVPEPATFAVLGLGALALIRRRRSNK